MSGTPSPAADAPQPVQGKLHRPRKEPLAPEYQDAGQRFVTGCTAAQAHLEADFPSKSALVRMELRTKESQEQMELVQEHVSRAKHILYKVH